MLQHTSRSLTNSSEPSKQELWKTLNELLYSTRSNGITSLKTIIQYLNSHFKCDLSHRKCWIERSVRSIVSRIEIQNSQFRLDNCYATVTSTVHDVVNGQFEANTDEIETLLIDSDDETTTLHDFVVSTDPPTTTVHSKNRIDIGDDNPSSQRTHDDVNVDVLQSQTRVTSVDIDSGMLWVLSTRVYPMLRAIIDVDKLNLVQLSRTQRTHDQQQRQQQRQQQQQQQPNVPLNELYDAQDVSVSNPAQTLDTDVTVNTTVSRHRHRLPPLSYSKHTHPSIHNDKFLPVASQSSLLTVVSSKQQLVSWIIDYVNHYGLFDTRTQHFLVDPVLARVFRVPHGSHVSICDVKWLVEQCGLLKLPFIKHIMPLVSPSHTHTHTSSSTHEVADGEDCAEPQNEEEATVTDVGLEVDDDANTKTSSASPSQPSFVIAPLYVNYKGYTLFHNTNAHVRLSPSLRTLWTDFKRGVDTSSGESSLCSSLYNACASLYERFIVHRCVVSNVVNDIDYDTVLRLKLNRRKTQNVADSGLVYVPAMTRKHKAPFSVRLNSNVLKTDPCDRAVSNDDDGGGGGDQSKRKKRTRTQTQAQTQTDTDALVTLEHNQSLVNSPLTSHSYNVADMSSTHYPLSPVQHAHIKVVSQDAFVRQVMVFTWFASVYRRVQKLTRPQ